MGITVSHSAMLSSAAQKNSSPEDGEVGRTLVIASVVVVAFSSNLRCQRNTTSDAPTRRQTGGINQAAQAAQPTESTQNPSSSWAQMLKYGKNRNTLKLLTKFISSQTKFKSSLDQVTRISFVLNVLEMLYRRMYGVEPEMSDLKTMEYKMRSGDAPTNLKLQDAFCHVQYLLEHGGEHGEGDEVIRHSDTTSKLLQDLLVSPSKSVEDTVLGVLKHIESFKEEDKPSSCSDGLSEQPYDEIFWSDEDEDEVSYKKEVESGGNVRQPSPVHRMGQHKPPQARIPITCKYNDSCKFGDNCKFEHIRRPPRARGSITCRFYIKGCCKFGDNCKDEHIRRLRGSNPNSYRT